MFHHLDFFAERSSPLGLGLFSEQAPEGAHHDFEMKWHDYVVLDMESEHYGPRLLDAVVSYNGGHAK